MLSAPGRASLAIKAKMDGVSKRRADDRDHRGRSARRNCGIDGGSHIADGVTETDIQVSIAALVAALKSDFASLEKSAVHQSFAGPERHFR